MIKLRNVSKVYTTTGQVALKNITFSVKPGEFIFITGPSGAGKSSLLRILFGEEVHTSGVVEVLGTVVNKDDRSCISKVRKRIGVVFQDYKLLPRMTVEENIGFPLEVLGVTKQARLERVKTILKAVQLEHKALSRPETLSGGEQQRVAVARALINRPSIIIADEPTGNVDPTMARRIFDLFIQANSKGCAIIAASHNLELIEELNKRTLLLDNGRVIDDIAC